MMPTNDMPQQKKANKLNPSAENQTAMDAAQADIDGWKDGGSYRAALHIAGGALIAGLGGGNALAGAAGAGAASLAGGKLGELSGAVAGGADTGNAALNETLGNIAANIVAGNIGAVVGGGSGAATAANVDRYNRQLHPDEKQLARKMAANSGGKYTAEQIEAQMRLSDRVDMNGKVLEYGTPDQIDAAKTKPSDTGVEWTSIAGTTQAKEVQAKPDAEAIAYIQAQQTTMQGDVPYTSRLDFGNAQKTSYAPGVLTTAKCGAGQADCAAGLPAGYSAEEIANRRTAVADAASYLGTQAGRVGAAATAAGTVPGPHVVAADALAAVATAANLAITAIQQVAKPNPGGLAADTISAGLGEAANAIPGYGKALAPVVNEFIELGKNSAASSAAQDKLNKALQK
ncbi:hypothetical protein Tamer19_12410 [Cupriavidus sp. TA19]|nr:hypothetical protein Tamer19_12410 [Cupriavidus sp. TA19]